MSKSRKASTSLPAFSKRETDVLVGLLMGHTNKRIATDLKLSDTTVKVHMKAILRKLRVNSRTQAVMLIMRAALSAPCPRCGYVDNSYSNE
jgi:DNA-binding NarL/FixJ family response regulator